MYGAAIGSGNTGSSVVDNIVIRGGVIRALFDLDSHGSAIGSAYVEGWSRSVVGNLTITGGTIEAGGGTEIGAGHGEDDGSSIVANLLIVGGFVNASSNRQGSALGAGHTCVHGYSIVGNLTIAGGTVLAVNTEQGSMNSAGVGAGHSINNGESYVEHLTIKGGIVHAIGGSGAGIGAGSGHMTGFSYVNDLQIVGGDVTTESRHGGAGIGGDQGISTSKSWLRKKETRLSLPQDSGVYFSSSHGSRNSLNERHCSPLWILLPFRALPLSAVDCATDHTDFNFMLKSQSLCGHNFPFSFATH
jgi:hypothetical protein